MTLLPDILFKDNNKLLIFKKISSKSCLLYPRLKRWACRRRFIVKTLVKLLSACDDLSLDFLFFGYGEIIKSKGNTTINYSDIHNDKRNIIGDTVKTKNNPDTDMLRLLEEKDRTISERDQTIGRLLQTISPSSTK